MATTMLIEWKDAMSVGIPSIDNQHKQLVDLINRLNAAMEDGETDKELGRIFSDLVAYTDQHFRHEEDLFERHAYPMQDAHRREHDALREKAISLKQRVDDGEFVLGVEVMNFLRDWLKSHIMGSDRAYSEHLRRHGAR